MDLLCLLPELALALMGIVFFCASMGRPDAAWLGRAAVALSVLTLCTAAATLDRQGLFFFSTYRIDLFSQSFKLLISLGLVLILWMGAGLRGVNERLRPEYFLFLALGCLGLFLMTSAVELLTIIISIEIASYALFVLIPLRRQPFQREPLEASIKYYFLGAIATGITLYGMSYLFGLAHSTYLAELAKLLPGLLANQPLAVIGLAMLLCGAFYKLALFPLHFWMPDVFTGAAHETTCLVATLPKVAATALIMRLVGLAGPDAHQIVQLLSIMAGLSMLAGNLTAIVQRDVKRLLAYSSIAHAGYLMAGILCLSGAGFSATMYYVCGYVFMNVACFTVLYRLAPQGENIAVEGLRGLHRRSPLLAALLATGAIGLAGIPPTIGFTGKLLIFMAVFERGLFLLLGVALVNICIGAFYYLRLVRAAYSSAEGQQEAVPVGLSAALLAITVLCGIVLSGVLPQPILRTTMQAILGMGW